MLVWNGTVEKLKDHVIQTTTQSEALQLEVETLKQDEDEDEVMTMLPPDAMVALMGSKTNQVGKAWDIMDIWVIFAMSVPQVDKATQIS